MRTLTPVPTDDATPMNRQAGHTLALIVLFGAAALLLPTLCQAQEITLEALNEAVSIRDLAFSPDGQKIALSSNKSGRSKIWVMERDGSDARMLVEDRQGEYAPAWSPNGKQIAFLRSEGGQSDLWTVDRTGENLRRVTDDPEGERSLAWGPQGQRIAFISGREGYQDIFVVDVASGHVEQLTEETNPVDEYRWAPVWAPDGAHIAYVSSKSGQWKDDLWLAELDTRDTHKITTNVQVMTTPVWSPNGEHIAFNAVQYSEFWYGDQSDIYLVEMPEENVEKVSMNTYVSDRNGSINMKWGPGSDFLYFRYEWEGDANLWRVPLEGGVATKMTYERGNIGNFSVSDRSVVYSRSTPTRRSEVHRFDLEGGAPVPLTDWQKDYDDISAPEKITYESRDGKYILGYRYLPPDFDSDRQYPALVQVHGGGNNAYGNGFHPLEHFLAKEGFVVVAIEYRGSAGHGRAFQDLSLGDWAAEQGWDAVAAARYLDDLSYTNGRVGIYGGSYGGIMTLAALTRTSDPFDAAAPLYGIYDWADAFENGDRLMKFWVIEGHEGYKPGERPDLYKHTASINHLEGIEEDLPFLIIHGEQDRRAPFQQSVRLAEALEKRGNPVQFYSYPEERHGFRKPENRRDAYGRLLSFFEEHLK